MHLAAITYSLFRSCRTSVLIILAILIQLVIPITKDRLNTFAFPRMACRKITVRRFGMLSRISVALMSSISSQSGAMPLTVPNTIAIPVDITVAAIPINRDCRPPDHGKNITPHSICSKQKFFTWSNCIIFQIHVRRIFCHDSIAEQTGTHNQYQNDDRQPWNRIIPSVFFFLYLLFCKLWFYSNNFKQVTHSYPPPAFPTAC